MDKIKAIVMKDEVKVEEFLKAREGQFPAELERKEGKGMNGEGGTSVTVEAWRPSSQFAPSNQTCLGPQKRVSESTSGKGYKLAVIR